MTLTVSYWTFHGLVHADRSHPVIAIAWTSFLRKKWQQIVFIEFSAAKLQLFFHLFYSHLSSIHFSSLFITYVCSNSFQENCLESKSCFSFPLFPKNAAKSVARIQYLMWPRIDLYSTDDHREKMLCPSCWTKRTANTKLWRKKDLIFLRTCTISCLYRW